MLFFVLTMVQAISAADYLVYSVIGDIQMVQNNKKVSLSARQTINSQTRIAIGKESAVNVLDEKNSKLYSFTTPGTYTVAALIQDAKTPKSLSSQYVSYLVKQLFSKESHYLKQAIVYRSRKRNQYRRKCLSR